jgi:hypothetical protein
MATQTLPRIPGTPTQPANPNPNRTLPRRPAPGHPDTGSPRHTRPGAGPQPQAAPVTGSRTRAPFIVLLVGLLGGALVSLLVISTTLAAGSFRISTLKQQNTNLTREEQALTAEVAQQSNPAYIAGEAQQLGMRQDPYLRFINLKTGKIVIGKASKSESAIHVPGYTP